MASSVDTVNASSSSSSSSLPSTNIFYEDRKKFDVFLSFRGSDTRKSFTDHLYSAIEQKGISTFRDEERLERGKSIAEELSIAIEESKFAVVVLSRNYAFSTWCLNEVAKIVECMEKKKLIVVPIFYHVDPSDVRNQIGPFAEAFAKHEERFKDSTENVNLWRVALTKVAKISGWVLNHDNLNAQWINDTTESLSNLSISEAQWINKFTESFCNHCIRKLEDGSVNLNLPPIYDEYPDEADDADDEVVDLMQDDADEIVQDYVADLPLEARVVEDHVANLPQEAHVVEDHVATSQRECPICVTNARNMAFGCGHTTCVECGERLDKCPICRKLISCRIRLFLG